MTKRDSNQDNLDIRHWSALAGNEAEASIEYLFTTYYVCLARFAWRYVGSETAAEEIVQEFFSRLWKKRKELAEVGSVRSYLYKSVRNLSLNYLNQEKLRNHYNTEWLKDECASESEPPDEIREQEIKKAIATAIESLPARSRMTYKLHRYDGLTYEEIAEIMDISVKTVESQMTRTLKLLRERLAHLLSAVLVLMLAG